MKYKILVNCPDKKKLIDTILDTAFANGAIAGEHYTRCAMLIRGDETWKTLEGANPYKGEVGKITIESSVQISFACSKEKVKQVVEAVKKIHPYETPVITILKVEELEDF